MTCSELVPLDRAVIHQEAINAIFCALYVQHQSDELRLQNHLQNGDYCDYANRTQDPRKFNSWTCLYLLERKPLSQLFSMESDYKKNCFRTSTIN